MLVSSFGNLCLLLSMPGIKLFNSFFKPQGLWVIAVGFVFVLQCADYAVQFRVFTQQVLAVKLRNGDTPDAYQTKHQPKQLLNKQNDVEN
jgi:hypothetical protein